MGINGRKNEEFPLNYVQLFTLFCQYFKYHLFNLNILLLLNMDKLLLNI